MTDTGKGSTSQKLRIRWIRPAWLEWDQALTYGGLPPYVLRELIANRLLRTQTFPAKGRLIRRESIDEILTESVIHQQPVCWGERRRGANRQ
jgi:hypothetical protein